MKSDQWITRDGTVVTMESVTGLWATPDGITSVRGTMRLYKFGTRFYDELEVPVSATQVRHGPEGTVAVIWGGWYNLFCADPGECERIGLAIRALEPI